MGNESNPMEDYKKGRQSRLEQVKAQRQGVLRELGEWQQREAQAKAMREKLAHDLSAVNGRVEELGQEIKELGGQNASKQKPSKNK